MAGAFIKVKLTKELATKMCARAIVNLTFINGLVDDIARETRRESAMAASLAAEQMLVVVSALSVHEIHIDENELNAEIMKYIDEVNFEFGADDKLAS